MSLSVSLSQVLQWLEVKAPSGTAESWDNVGLLAGDPSWETSSAVVSIDLTRQVVDQAIRKKSHLVVTHHPSIFPRGRGLSRIVPGESEELSSLIFECLRKGIGIVACHTNFDRCALEVVQLAAQALGVEPKGRLHDKSDQTDLIKLVAFVPETHIDAVREAVCEAGAGQIGNYDFCGFSVDGEGTFRGGPGTRPFLGQPGQIERVREIRFETIFPRGLQQQIIRALIQTHPYEEAAYDLIPTEQRPSDEGIVKGLGYGFWGELSASPSFSEFAARVRQVFGVEGFTMSGNTPLFSKKRVRKIAFVAGKGAAFLNHASSLDCDLMITGEAGYHTALSSARAGMAVIELGHRESEKFFPKVISDWLTDQDFKPGFKVFQSDSAIQRLVIC